MASQVSGKDTFVSDLKAGDRVTTFFLVRQMQMEPFRDQSKGEFLTLMLADRTGQILGRVWENAAAAAAAFEVGDVIKTAGDVETYQGRMQFIVQRVRRANDDEYDLRDFLPATTRDTGQMQAEVEAAVARVTDPHLAALLEQFYGSEEFIGQLAQAPATRRLHHAYLGGWLEHLTQVLALAETVLAIYPEINADLLRVGTLLLSAGKLREHTWSRDIEYTDAGRLLGHVMLADEEVARAIAAVPGFPAELGLRVRHMLASYRGRAEYGAPRPPMTMEAIALHHIESLNTQISRFRDVLGARRDTSQPWTGYDRLLGRYLYAGSEEGSGDREEVTLED
jgi:3'-5' exoribonuclease